MARKQKDSGFPGFVRNYWYIWVVIFVVIISPKMTTIESTPSLNVCGDGPVRPWSLTPDKPQKAYVVLTRSNTDGALPEDIIRSSEMMSKGVFVGLGGETDSTHLAFVTPTSIEQCQSGKLKIKGLVNAVLYNQALGEIWAVTDDPPPEGYGVYHFSGNTWKNYTTKDGLPANKGYDVAIDQQGRINVATMSGIAWFDRGQGKFFKNEELFNPVYPQNVHAMLFLPDRTMLGLVSDGLLMKMDDDWTWFRADELEGRDAIVVPEMRSNNVRVLEIGPDGRVWIGNDPGLPVYNPQTGDWEDQEPGYKSAEFQVLDLAFDYGDQLWVTGSSTYGGGDAHWNGGLTLSLGPDEGGIWSRDTVIIGTEAGLYIGKMSAEAPNP